MTETSIPAETRIGHVHLKVADLERAIGFYRDYLGFDLLFNMGSAAFLSAGGYHHHIGLNTWESKDGAPPVPGTTGLYHFAINYPTRKDLAAWAQQGVTGVAVPAGSTLTAPAGSEMPVLVLPEGALLRDIQRAMQKQYNPEQTYPLFELYSNPERRGRRAVFGEGADSACA